MTETKKAKKVYRSTEEFEREMFPRATATAERSRSKDFARDLGARLAESALRQASQPKTSK
jgi:hypothetical protein